MMPTVSSQPATSLNLLCYEAHSAGIGVVVEAMVVELGMIIIPSANV